MTTMDETFVHFPRRRVARAELEPETVGLLVAFEPGFVGELAPLEIVAP